MLRSSLTTRWRRRRWRQDGIRQRYFFDYRKDTKSIRRPLSKWLPLEHAAAERHLRRYDTFTICNSTYSMWFIARKTETCVTLGGWTSNHRLKTCFTSKNHYNRTTVQTRTSRGIICGTQNAKNIYTYKHLRICVQLQMSTDNTIR